MESPSRPFYLVLYFACFIIVAMNALELGLAGFTGKSYVHALEQLQQALSMLKTCIEHVTMCACDSGAVRYDAVRWLWKHLRRTFDAESIAHIYKFLVLIGQAVEAPPYDVVSKNINKNRTFGGKNA